MKGLKQLKIALYESFTTDAALINLLGDQHIYDLVQQDAKLPYISYGKIVSHNIGQIHEEMWQHELEIIVAATADSALSTHNILARIEFIIEEIIPQKNLANGYQIVTTTINQAIVEQMNFEIVKGKITVLIITER